ncbi:MAG: hypothetical protein Ta2A_10860 [Treponemataceae bacterium]|nr:MAG: hypothetical protein Ta2A_10860 [Treponemataceae bacterium]
MKEYWHTHSPHQVLSVVFRMNTRIVIFLSLWLLTVFALYGVGSFRQFLDATLLLLLKTASYTAIALIVVLACYLVQIIVLPLIYKDTRYYLYAGIFIPAIALAVIALVVTALVHYLAAGIR